MPGSMRGARGSTAQQKQAGCLLLPSYISMVHLLLLTYQYWYIFLEIRNLFRFPEFSPNVLSLFQHSI